MKRLIISVPAVDDLEEIWNFIAEDSLEAANRVEGDLLAAMEKLCEIPGMGHERTDVKNKAYRFWKVYSYLIAYRVDGDVLYVSRVIHGARNLRKLFPMLKRSK